MLKFVLSYPPAPAELLSCLLEQSKQLVLVLDQEGCFTRAGGAAAAVLGEESCAVGTALHSLCEGGEAVLAQLRSAEPGASVRVRFSCGGAPAPTVDFTVGRLEEGFLLLGTDVSSLVALEGEREQLALMLKELEERTRVGTWSFDLRTGRAHLSRQGMRLHGFPDGLPLEGQLFEGIKQYPDDAREVVTQLFNDSIEHNKPYDSDFPFDTIQGERRRVRTTGRAIFENGAPVQVIGIFEDVTEEELRRRALGTLQKGDAIGRMVGGIAHDFNNLLTAILGAAELAWLERESPRQLEAELAVITDTSLRGAELANKLLTFGAGRSRRLMQVELGALVSDLFATLTRLLPPEVELRYDPPADSLLVHADPTEIDQIIVNLVVNASHAVGERGSISVGVRALERGDSEEEWVSLYVKDTGHGIAPEQLERIFDPFYSTKGQGGFGLGLSTIRELVRNMSGDIEVESTPGRGTNFSIRLRRLAAARTSPDDPQRLPKPLLSGTERVLVVDDEEHIRRTATGVLERFGYQVTSAKDGIDALAKLKSEGPVDVLVTDLHMPEMDGLSLAREALGRGMAGHVLFMSAPESNREVPDASHAFLPKPFRPRALAAAIRELLEEK